MCIKNLFRLNGIMRIRIAIAKIRHVIDPYYQIRNLRSRLNALEANLYYELESEERWLPKIMGLEETLRYVIDHKCSMARYGDGEFELMAGRDMSFELSNDEMAKRLKDILRHPIPNCLNCVPNIFGSLARYRAHDVGFWRGAALFMRPILRECISQNCVAQNAILGDPQVSRAYLGVGNGEMAPRIFGLWKELFANKRILIVEGRFSRLGVGNDLFSGVKAIKRIWCPAKGAYSWYSEIMSAILEHAQEVDLVILALGATATLLAYDLAKKGVWAVDAGHIDVEYMWMKMGVHEKTPIPGRYVNECAIGGREMKNMDGEDIKLNVVKKVGCK